MAFKHALSLLTLGLLALAAPPPALEARQDTISPSVTTAACATNALSVAVRSCVSQAGINSVCSGVTSRSYAVSTITVSLTTTRRSTVATSYTSTTTRVSTRATTVVRTTTITSTSRVTSGSTRTLAGTVTSEVTSTSTQYTCPNSRSSASFPAATPTEDSSDLLRRQTSTPDCLEQFREDLGARAIIEACRCLRPSLSIPTVTVTVVATSFDGVTTVTQLATRTTRTTTRTTTTLTSTSVVSSTIETTTTVPSTIPYISTVRSTSVTTVTSAYPLPSGRFRIFITINGQRLYGRNVRAASTTPGTDDEIDVIALSPADEPNRQPSLFGFNNLMNLLLSGTQTKITVEQRTYEVPYVWLVPNGLPLPDPWTAPSFAPCNGSLIPGGAQANHIFAACISGNSGERRLAFGSPGTWSGRPNRDDDAAQAMSNGTCIQGEVGIETISGSSTPALSSTSDAEPTATETSDVSLTSDVEESSTTETGETPTTTPPPDTTSPASSSASPTSDESSVLPVETSAEVDAPASVEVTEPLPDPTSTPPTSPQHARAPEAY
ncbi:hypothetical protein Slin15195_G024840 [Septoria linicola]|uniref:Uncharacterized protein n=1 Tax=Septoria linicola TaxID=215465 RepID=A0A9Q9AMI7_9PEZI|nr:hypothetical protein Slin14017_G023930 [Septoria linicola]USW49165.1 hypothetical protein Slin15195_G024840 [Septoria linicola]